MIVRALGLLLLLSIPRGVTTDERFEAFSKDYVGGLNRVSTSPNASGYGRVKFFADLLRAEIDKAQLSIDNRIDYEILDTKLDAVLDGYRTFGPDAVVPVSVLPPKGFLKELTLLATRETFSKRLAAATTFDGAVSFDWSASNDEALKQIDALVKEINDFSVAAIVSGADDRVVTSLRDARERLAAFRKLIADAEPGERAPPKKKAPAGVKYQYALKYTLLTAHTPETLLKLAQTWWDDTIAKLEACAKRIDATKTWRELIEDCKQEAYGADEYHDAALALAQKARDFAVEKELVTIPAGGLDFDVRKGSKGQITPFGHYQPGMGKTKGAYVTAPVTGLSEEDLKERLRDNNKYWTTIVALHEAVPGHHLQFEVARTQKRSALRRSADTSTYVEGWGLYCEEMMFLNGYYEDGTKQRLTALKMRLWRCARVKIDVGIQTGTMTTDDAVKLLTEQVTLEPTSAKLEVQHYAARPTYFCGYLVGWLAFTELREAVKKELGGRFDQKSFHDAILDVGPMPLGLLHKAVMHRLAP